MLVPDARKTLGTLIFIFGVERKEKKQTILGRLVRHGRDTYPVFGPTPGGVGVSLITTGTLGLVGVSPLIGYN